MRVTKMLNNPRVRVQSCASAFPYRPGLCSLYLFQLVAACEPAVVGTHHIIALIHWYRRLKVLPVIRKYAACTVLIEPGDISGAAKKNTPKNQPHNPLSMGLGVYQTESRPPTATKQQPALNTQKRAYCFHILNKLFSTVSL